ncbi:MAG: AMP-binding protein [Candidatus Helarchaeota archaeon]
MAAKRVLPEKPIGKLAIKKSGKGYESVWLYLPREITKDPAFPFKNNDKVYVEIKDGKLIVSQTEKIFQLLDSFGLRNATIPNVIEQKAKEYQDKIFTIFTTPIYREISYKEMNECTNQLAHGLRQLKLGRKPKVAIMLPNIPEFLWAWFGVNKIGGVIVPINIYLRGEMLQYLLSHSDSEHIIIDYQYFDAFEKIKPNTPNIKTVIILNAPESIEFPEGYYRYKDILSPNTANPGIKVRDFQPMEILYTSGTTGRPKGVVYRNYFVLAGLLVGNELKEGGFTENDILFCPLPFFHAFAQLLAILPGMFLGGKVVIDDRFHATDFWERATKYKATAFTYVGGMLSLLLKQPKKPIDTTHTIRVAYGGGAPKSVWEEFEKRFNVRIFEGWSLSEAVGFTLNKEGSAGGKTGSIGRSIEGFMLKIVGADGKELPPAEDPYHPRPENIGEILAKSSLPLSLEYYKQRAAVKKKIDADGFVHTGDMGYKDKDGFVYFAGRKKDMIRRRGENISAKEVERVVNAHPAVLESAAFAVPADIEGDEDLKIVVVLKPSEKLTASELVDFMKERTAYFMLPRYVEFKTEAEFAHYKTATERIKKYQLQKEFSDAHIQSRTWDGVREGYKYKEV